MPYNFIADIIRTKNFVADFKWSAILHRKRSFCVGVRGNVYDAHLRLSGKGVVDLVLNALTFFARCYGWGAGANID